MSDSDISFYELVSTLQKLNPGAGIKVSDHDNAKIQSSIPMDKLVLPESFYFNEKNGITNKDKSKSGNYLSVRVNVLPEVEQGQEQEAEQNQEPKKEAAQSQDRKKTEDKRTFYERLVGLPVDMKMDEKYGRYVRPDADIAKTVYVNMEKQLRKVMEEHNQKLREYHPLAQYWFEGVNTAQKVVLNRYKNQLWETAKRISKQENLNLDFSPDLKNGVIPDERLEEVIENCSKYLKNLSLLRDDSATVGMKNTWYGALDRFYDIREAVEEKKEPSQKPTLAELCNDYTNPSSTKGQVLLELAKQLRFRDPCEIYAKNPEEHEKLLETKKNMEFLAGLAREGYSVKTNPEFKDFMPKWAHKTVGKAIDRAADYIVDKGDSSGLIGWAEWACDGISRFSKNAAKVLDTVGKAFDKVSGGNFYVKDASRYVNRETLAEVCGVSFATIENWSMGRAVMSDENMRKIAEFYDLDLEDEKSHAANTASAVAEAKRPPANKNPSESVNTGYPAVLPQIDPFEDLNLEEALNNQPTPNQNINPRPRSIPPVKEKSQERDVLAL